MSEELYLKMLEIKLFSNSLISEIEEILFLVEKEQH